MGNNKKQANNEKTVEQLVRSIEKQFKDLRFQDLLMKLQPQWEHAKPKRWDDLTEAEQKAIAEEQDQLHRELKREQGFDRIRQVLQIGIDIKSDDPSSELFTTGKELMDIVDRYESDPSSVSNYEWRRFLTGLSRYEALLKAQSQLKGKPAETNQDTTPPAKRLGVKKGICLFIIVLVLILAIFRFLGWPEPIKAFKGIYSFIIFLAALLACLYYLGCLEPIKRFIISILWPK